MTDSALLLTFGMTRPAVMSLSRLTLSAEGKEGQKASILGKVEIQGGLLVLEVRQARR